MLSEKLSKKTPDDNYKLWTIIIGALMRRLILVPVTANVQANGTAKPEVRKNVI